VDEKEEKAEVTKGGRKGRRMVIRREEADVRSSITCESRLAYSVVGLQTRDRGHVALFYRALLVGHCRCIFCNLFWTTGGWHRISCAFLVLSSVRASGDLCHQLPPIMMREARMVEVWIRGLGLGQLVEGMAEQ